MEKVPFVAIDFETANELRRSPCSIGLVKFDADGSIVDTYEQLIDPHPSVNYFNPVNMWIHGITADDVADAPEWDNIAGDIRQFIGDLPLVAHNMSFDGSVLDRVNDLYDLEPFVNVTTVHCSGCSEVTSGRARKIHTHRCLPPVLPSRLVYSSRRIC